MTDTKASLTADEAFLMDLKEKCQMTDKEWEERQKTRQLEMEAVSKALEILSGDEAHDLFSRTLGFLQTSSVSEKTERTKAATLISTASKKFNNPRLAILATKVKLDAFTRVKAAIDEMITALKKEKADEIKHKDFCVDAFNTNERDTENKNRDKNDLLGKIDDLNMQINTLTSEIEKTQSEIKDMQVEMKRAGEDREKQNKEFQVTISDQQATQKLLQAALGVLQKFYGKKSFLQQEPAGPPPPAGFETYKKNAASGGVTGMIQQIIDDAKAMETEATRSEEDSQKAYEDFVQETNASIEKKTTSVTNLSDTKAKAEGSLVESKESKESVLLVLETLANENAELHGSCDFVMQNFDLRQAARDQEVEALGQAKSILSGSNFE